MDMLNWFKKSVAGTLGMEVSPFGVAIAYLSDVREEGLEKAECEYFESSITDSVEKLEQWISDRDLENIKVQVTLHPSLYTLYFVDRPDVEDDQLSDAVRWKLKDLVDTPLKDLIVDAFPLPDDAYRGNQKKVYVAAIERNVIQDIVEQLKKLPVEIGGISIGELSDRSILSLMNEDSGGAALLRLRSSNGSINLIDDGDLYLTRPIESGVALLESANEENRTAVLDELLLQVQRCLDFYDSQLGKGAIRKMLVAPTKLDRNFFDAHLRDHLGMSVHTLDLNEVFLFPTPMSGQLQSTCFAALAVATENRSLA